MHKLIPQLKIPSKKPIDTNQTTIHRSTTTQKYTSAHRYTRTHTYLSVHRLSTKVFQTFRSVNRSYGNLRKQTFGFESIYSLTVWPDLAKFRHFGSNFQKSWTIFQNLYLVFGIILNLFNKNCYWAIFHCWKWPNIE